MSDIRAASGPRIVDYQAHWYPRSVLEAEAAEKDPRVRRLAGDAGYEIAFRPGGYGAPVPPPYFELDQQLASMDRHGIDVAVVSANLISDVGGLEGGRAQHYVDMGNHALAEAQREHAGRIYGLAMLPVEHPERALQSLNTAIVDEGLRGVCLLSNIAGGPIVNDALLPVYARIAELGVPIFLHPANGSMVESSGVLPVIDVGAGWMLDTAAAALTLIYTGLLDRHPELTVVHPHFGGIIPFVRGRVVDCLPPEVEHDLDWYLRNRFYADAATDTPKTLPLAVDAYGADRLLYASDWPWYPHDHSFGLLDAHEDPAMRETILANRLPGLIPER